jgi:hypothetical protein
MPTRKIRFFATSHLLLYRPEMVGGCGGVTGIVHAGHADGGGHAGAGAPLDPGDVAVNRPPPPAPAFALSSEVAPVIPSGPGVVGDLSHGSVDS